MLIFFQVRHKINNIKMHIYGFSEIQTQHRHIVVQYLPAFSQVSFNTLYVVTVWVCKMFAAQVCWLSKAKYLGIYYIRAKYVWGRFSYPIMITSITPPHMTLNSWPMKNVSSFLLKTNQSLDLVDCNVFIQWWFLSTVIFVCSVVWRLFTVSFF